MQTTIRSMLALGLLALPTLACTSMKIPVTEVPRLRSATVRTVDGTESETPARWHAEFMPRKMDGWRFMSPPSRSTGVAIHVPETDVDRAEEAGWTEKHIEMEGPAASRIEGRVLWIQDREGRTVAVPIDAVEHVKVTDLEARTNRNIGIALGAALGAALVIGAVVAVGSYNPR